MNQINKPLYKLIFNIALTYRLSLDNVCIILGKEVTETNKKNIYDICMYLYNQDNEVKAAFKYLFNFETVNEPKEVSEVSLKEANLFIYRYKEACKIGDKEKINEIKSSLNTIDKDFKKLLNQNEISITNENILTISKYRIKYGLARIVISKCLGVHHTYLINKEQEITDERLKNKLKLLSEYHLDIVNNDKRNVK